jgi:hypothetical protein
MSLPARLERMGSGFAPPVARDLIVVICPVPALRSRTVTKFVEYLRGIRILLAVIVHAYTAGHVLQDLERASCAVAM